MRFHDEDDDDDDDRYADGWRDRNDIIPVN